MKKNTLTCLLLAFIFTLSFGGLKAQQSSNLYGNTPIWETSFNKPYLPEADYEVKFSLSHGHCQLPMEARLSDVKITDSQSTQSGPKINFDIAMHALKAAGGNIDEFTAKMKSKESFDVNTYPIARFECKDSYNLGKDWYELVGTMTIKGVTKPAKFRVRPVYDHAGCGRILQKYVIDGSLNAKEFGVSEGNVGGDADLDRDLRVNLVVKSNGC